MTAPRQRETPQHIVSHRDFLQGFRALNARLVRRRPFSLAGGLPDSCFPSGDFLLQRLDVQCGRHDQRNAAAEQGKAPACADPRAAIIEPQSAHQPAPLNAIAYAASVAGR